MITREIVLTDWCWGAAKRTATAEWPSPLCLVTSQELGELGHALGAGGLPLDFESKLGRMHGGNLTERYVEQTSRLILELLLAHEQGFFRDVSDAERARLLRVLAYVRKDEDVVPDYQRDGYKDDAKEIRAVEADLRQLLTGFKTWRLRHQVPALWLRAGAQLAKPREAAC